jgi:recombinational DNA repair ATPase RecF
MKSQLIKGKNIVKDDWVTSELAKVEEIVKMQAGKVVAFKLSGEDYPANEQVKETIFPDTGKVLLPLKVFILHQEKLSILLKNSLEKDMFLQYTSKGIHKDDLIFNINNYSVKKFGSQGQQKSLLIALKLAQFDFLKNQTNNNPILLLDDIFDKLDKNRVKQIINLVSANDFGQIFISDTEEERTKESIKEITNSNSIFNL